MDLAEFASIADIEMLADMPFTRGYLLGVVGIA
jgi:hypothetical protein